MLVGAAIGAKIHSFWAIFIFAAVSHFLTDFLPHWDYIENLEDEIKNKFLVFNLKIFTDFAIGLAIFLWLFWNSPFIYYAFFGALVAILPDSLILLRSLFLVYLKKRLALLEKYFNFHKKFHFYKDKRFLFWGIICELTVAALAIVIILS
jgi:hypothetical protein